MRRRLKIMEKDVKLYFARRCDYAQMAEIYRPYVENTTVSFEYVAPQSSQFAARMEALDGKFPVIVCREGEEVLGYAYASPAFERAAYGWCADLSVYIRSDCRGRGLGRRLTLAVCDILRALGYRVVYSLVTGENVQSCAFHSAMGFEKVAEFPRQGYKSGRWLSVIWFEKELNGEEAGAHFPLSFDGRKFDLSRY